MRKLILLLFATILITLSGCYQMPQSQAVVKETEPSEMPDVTSTPTPTSVPTETPIPTLEPQELPDEIGYIQVHFDVLGIDLPVPQWVEDWDNRYETQENGYVGFDSGSGEIVDITAFLPDDGINIMTGEPYVYDEYYFDDAAPEDIVNWSDIDGLFRIHASRNGIDTFMSVYHIPEYSYTIKMTCPTEMVEKYQTAFDHVCEALKEVEPNPQMISEEDIIKYCQEKYKSPLAEIDRYEEGYKPIVHLYENVENDEESHMATWGWVKVDPVTGEATDEMTYETFVIPGAKLSFE